MADGLHQQALGGRRENVIGFCIMIGGFFCAFRLKGDSDDREEIRKFLTENSADRSGTETAGKIFGNLGGSPPARITDVPYIRRKHREISPQVFKRKSVGSFSNCLACHKGAEQGNFDDDQAVIPQ